MNTNEPVYSVSQINYHIRDLLDHDRVLNGLFVCGEISNYKAYPSGHHYFSLKDEESSIRCVMFKREAVHLKFRPENGMKVIAYGRISVFPRDGQYQLYCTRLTPDGIGDLHIAFEQLKNRLYQAGYFNPAHKKPIPRYPDRIALVTSSAGAAVRDMIRILGARWPMARVFVLPVRVQGTEAPAEICAAIAWANRCKVADLIITGRGGGSMEDLWAFNDESVASTIYHSEIPVISAVGHEPDVTIADFVADLRASTPSNGAELAVPDQNDIRNKLQQLSTRLGKAMSHHLERAHLKLNRAENCRQLQNPMYLLDERRQLLDYQQTRLVHGLSAGISREKQRFVSLAASLDAMSPLKVLARGYAIPRRDDGTMVRSAADVAHGDRVDVQVADGTIHCEVI